MTKKINIETAHQSTAVYLLREAGLEPLSIAGDEIVLADGSEADINAALENLPAIAAERAASHAINAAKTAIREAIDDLSEKLTEHYTGTEKDGWIAMLAEANTFTQSNDPADAPGLSLDAAIRGDTLADRAASVLAAAAVTGLIPSLASGMRAKTEKLVEDTGGDKQQIADLLETLATKGQAILEAAEQSDRDQIIALATTDWEL